MKAIEVAGALIKKPVELGIAMEAKVTPMKLQKLLFFAQEEHLARTGNPLFEEDIEAWDYGPVVKEVWNVYQGDAPIERAKVSPSKIDEAASQTIRIVWERYGKYDAWYLSELTHSYKIWQDHYKNGVIPKDEILAYRQEIDNAKKEAEADGDRAIAMFRDLF
jgi:uncharacterized phage-associated protein